MWATAIVAATALFLIIGIFAAWHTLRAAHAGERGKAALLRAEHGFTARDLNSSRQDLKLASSDFSRMHSELRAMGPILAVARVIPFVRVQVRGIEGIADAGSLLSQAGIGLATAEERIVHPTDPNRPTSAALEDMRAIRAALHTGLGGIDAAMARVSSLRRYRLLGPIATARNALAARLPSIQTKAASVQDGLDALIAFSGGNGPRRYLILSQNPDEVRPTGGYIGTYGILNAESGHLSLERYDSTDSWWRAKPEAVVPADQAPTAFSIPTPPVAQTLANVNSSPDWPQAARLAQTLWQAGGEKPVDGAISFVPAFLARILGVLGPVAVPTYNETVTAANLVDRTNYYTHVVAGGEDKQFLVSLAQVVFQRLLDAPTSTWVPLGNAVGQGLGSREAMAWSADQAVETSLHQRGWDGALPATAGDFLADAEFEYGAKNGAGIKRTFDHMVTLRPDGSAGLSTSLTIDNTQTAAPQANIDSLSYITLYGPHGAVLSAGADPPFAVEPDIAGHPAAGWLRSAAPQSKTTLQTTWEAPAIAVRQPDGSWTYLIRWMHLPGHSGDVLHLQVDPPDGWQWVGERPPATVNLDQDFHGSWILRPGRASSQ